MEKFLEEQQTTIQNTLHTQDPTVSDGVVKAVLTGFVSDEGTKRPVRYTRLNNIITLGEAEQGFFPKLKPTTLTACLTALETARLIRTDDESIELAHDSLAALIDSKRTAEERRLNDMRRQIRLAYQTFPATQEYLTRKQINAFEDVLPDLDLEPSVLTFFNDSRSIRTEEEAALLKREQKRLRILRGIAAAAVFGLLIAVWFYFDANKSKQEANENLSAALKAKLEADTAKAIAQREADKAVLAKTQAITASSLALFNAREAKRQKDIAETKSKQATESLNKMKVAEQAKLKTEINKYITSAKRMRDAGDKETAQMILKKALELDKNNADVLKMLNEISKK